MEFRLDGPVLNLTTPSYGRATVSSFRAHYEEKVRSFAHRAMAEHGVSRVDDSFIYLYVDIHTSIYEEPIGVAKAVMDALTCTVYGDDSQVRTLHVRWTESAECYVYVTARRELHIGDMMKFHGEIFLDVRVPGTPVSKGLPYSQSRVVELPEPDEELVALLRHDEIITGDVMVDFCITATDGFNDPDNIVRYYLRALRAAGVLVDARVVAMYITAMDRNAGDEVKIVVYAPE